MIKLKDFKSLKTYEKLKAIKPKIDEQDFLSKEQNDILF
jgi:hypothetical protein